MTNWENVVMDKELAKAARLRRLTYYEKKAYTSAKEDMIIDGWDPASQYADPRFTKYRKDKPFHEVFEDSVWMMFYNMGFYAMNKDRNFRMVNDPNNPSLTKQIDVFAVEDETVFIIECKASETPRDVNFKTDIEALRGNKEYLMKEVRKLYPERKIVFVWATQGIILGNKDLERLKEWNIVHFDDSAVQYYQALTQHLGKAAKYQLLGAILKGHTIKNMNMDVPAIKSKMGGLEYYSFSIEPEKLLKISYVLHRNRTNSDTMLSYQRLIKRSRLQSIRKFINGGGYFPNAVVVSIDTGGKNLQFDEAPGSMKVDGTVSRIGVLHLPKQYHTAYIIDGQHRLYGFSESEYGQSDSIPVVAFVNLDPSEQLKLFMDINENQKAVSKTLRTILNKDMFLDSPDKAKQRVALRSKIAQELAESSYSPLFKRVIISEDDKETDTMCITVDALTTAIGKCGFFSEYGKNNTLKKRGSFDFDNVDKTSDVFFKFMSGCLAYIKTNCPTQWERGKSGALAINRGIQACIRVIDDLVSLLQEQGKINPLKDDIQKIIDEVSFYLDPLCEYLENITDEQERELKQTYGTNADLKFYRYYQRPIAQTYHDYNPEGMEKYFDDQSKKFNEDTRTYIDGIEKALRNTVRKLLIEKYGAVWQKDGVPKDILKRIHNDAFDKQLNEGITVDDWDCTTLKDFADIAIYAANWSTVFESVLTRPGDTGKGKKEEKIAWIGMCDAERNKLLKNPSYSVSRDSFNTISTIYKWLCE